MKKKNIPFCIQHILSEYSDERHILTRGDIEAHLLNLYGITSDRRTVYSAVEMLQQMGHDISTYSENGIGYYLCERVIEPSEVHLLTDAVCALPFISGDQTLRLINKLQSLLSVYERRHIRNLTIDRSDCKTVNKNVFFNIDMLDEAIEKKVQVQFDYCSYGTDKQLHNRRDEPYIVNPYGLTYSNEHYYLICNMEGKPKPSMYRIDRIRNIRLTDVPRDVPGTDFSVDQFVSKAVYAHGGESELVTLRIDRSVLSDVIDKFGTDIIVGEPVRISTGGSASDTASGDDKLIVSVNVAPAGMKYWALQYLAHVEVLSPLALREEIMDIIRHNPYFAGTAGEAQS